MLLCVIFGLLVFVDLPVIFSSSKDDKPTDTPDLRRPFSKNCFSRSTAAFLGTTSLEGCSGSVCEDVVLLVNI